MISDILGEEKSPWGAKSTLQLIFFIIRHLGLSILVNFGYLAHCPCSIYVCLTASSRKGRVIREDGSAPIGGRPGQG